MSGEDKKPVYYPAPTVRGGRRNADPSYSVSSTLRGAEIAALDALCITQNECRSRVIATLLREAMSARGILK